MRPLRNTRDAIANAAQAGAYSRPSPGGAWPSVTGDFISIPLSRQVAKTSGRGNAQAH